MWLQKKNLRERKAFLPGYLNKEEYQIGTVSFNRLRCGACGGLVKYKAHVYVDIINTVIHQYCYTAESLEIKDKGTFDEMINKYSFFDGLNKSKVKNE